MTEYVAINRENGNLALVVPIGYHDNKQEFEIAQLPDTATGYTWSVQARSPYPDGYLIESTFDAESTCWLFINRESFEKACEIIGEL